MALVDVDTRLLEGHPDLIGLEAPVGFDMLEAEFGHDPEQLAVNSALAFILLLDETERVTRLGLDNPYRGQPSQEFLDKLLDSLAAPAHRAGYAALFQGFNRYFGGSPDTTRQLLTRFKEEKAARALPAQRIHAEARLERTEEVARLSNPFRQAAIQFLEERIGLSELEAHADSVFLWEYRAREVGKVSLLTVT